MRHFLPLLAACVLVPTLGASTAFAQSPTGGAPQSPTAAEIAAKRDPHVRAAALFQRGSELHDQGQCEEAVAKLEGAWALEKNAATASLLGECEVKLARWVPAATHLAFVLRDLQDGPERQRLEPLFTQARAQVGGVRVQTSVDGADIFADNRIVGRTPLREEAFVEPGEVTITVKKTSVGEMAQTVQVAKGSSATVHLEPPRPLSDEESGYAPEPRSRAPVFVLAGAALVAVGAGIGRRVVGGNAGAVADDELALVTRTTMPASKSPCLVAANAMACDDIKAQRSKHDTFLNASTGLFALGGVALVGSIAYALWPAEKTGESHKITVLPSASLSSGSLLVQGAF